jgi:fucose permease
MQVAAADAPVHRTHVTPGTLIHVAFVPTGMVTVMLGPLLPLLAAKWALNDAQSGDLISAQFLGALLGTIASGMLLPRCGFRRSVSAGQALMACGAAALASGGFLAGLIAVFCYGSGIGLTIPAGNLLVAASYPDRRSSTLNLLNFCWSAGAVACPFLLVACRKLQGVELFLYGLAAAFIVLTAVSLLGGDVDAAPSSHRSSESSQWFKFLRNPAALMLAILFFVYVGTENAIGTWLSSFAQRITDAHLLGWMTISSYFYGALLLGRIMAPITLRHVSDARQAVCGALLAFAASVMLVLSHSIFAVAACAFVAGLGLSTLYPITIGFLSSTFGKEAERIGGTMFALSTFGGASVPWLVGFSATKAHSLRAGLLIPVAGSALMLALFSRPQWRQLSAEASSANV